MKGVWNKSLTKHAPCVSSQIGELRFLQGFDTLTQIHPMEIPLQLYCRSHKSNLNQPKKLLLLFIFKNLRAHTIFFT
jgi:hypothetical protein